MNFLLDTADLQEIERLIDLYPIEGVTTNPSIIANTQKEIGLIELLTNIREIIGNERMLHVQVLSKEAEEMIEEAKFLNQKLDGNLYIKIPVIPEGIKAIKELTKQDIKTTATAVFTPQQALMASKAGAKFVAPYVNRLDNISAEGVGVVKKIIEFFKVHNLDTKVLAASFKNVDQINQSCLSGSHAITASPEIIEKLVYHPMTNLGVEQFISDWEEAYGTKKLTADQ